MPQIFNRRLSKVTFGTLHHYRMLAQQLKSTTEMSNMILPSRTIYEYVIEEDEDKLEKERFEYGIHGGLKYGRGIR